MILGAVILGAVILGTAILHALAHLVRSHGEMDKTTLRLGVEL